MDMDAKDWIILRLLRILLESGHFSSHSDVIRTIDWLNDYMIELGVVAFDKKNPYPSYGLAMHSVLTLMNDIAKEYDPKPLPKHWRRS